MDNLKTYNDMKFWNLKINGVWYEVTTSLSITKPKLKEKLIELGYEVNNKNLYTSINTPKDCPDVFNETLVHIE